MNLRYAGICAVCATPVPQGAEAEWNGDRRTVTCLPCLDGSTLVDSGVAGSSARAESERRRAAQAERLQREREIRPIIARIGQTLWPERDAGRSWEKGAVGEEKFGAKLDEFAASNPSVLLLHDRLVPRTRANIDHIAVTASGIWVIDAKRYKDKRVERVDRGGLLRTEYHLRIGGRDGAKLVHGVHRQTRDIRAALDRTPFTDVQLRGSLCFIDADWALFAKPFAIDGVLVAWGKAIRERLVVPGPLDVEQRDALHRHLARSFPPAHRSPRGRERTRGSMSAHAEVAAPPSREKGEPPVLALASGPPRRTVLAEGGQ